jgi:hypothetical protein
MAAVGNLLECLVVALVADFHAYLFIYLFKVIIN